jgi:hypothetical protein
MTISSALYSSRTDEWPTPQAFFTELNAEFKFTLDPCASATNAKCPIFFTPQTGLETASSILQSAVRQNDARVGQEVL